MLNQVKLSKLLASAKAADTDQAAKAQALEAAISDKARADAVVVETHQSLAASIKAKGGIFIDTTARPLVQYTANADATDYTTLVVAGPDDVIDVPDAEPPPRPGALGVHLANEE